MINETIKLRTEENRVGKTILEEHSYHGTEITEKINDETTITVSPRWLFEVTLSIRREKGLNPGGDKLSSVRI